MSSNPSSSSTSGNTPGRQSVFESYQKPPQKGLSTHSTYHPGGYGVSEGLKRARRPFAFKNALVGGTLIVTAVNLYLYSIWKIKQDDFSDIGVPAGAPVPANQMKASSIPVTPSTSQSTPPKERMV